MERVGYLRKRRKKKEGKNADVIVDVTSQRWQIAHTHTHEKLCGQTRSISVASPTRCVCVSTTRSEHHNKNQWGPTKRVTPHWRNRSDLDHVNLRYC